MEEEQQWQPSAEGRLERSNNMPRTADNSSHVACSDETYRKKEKVKYQTFFPEVQVKLKTD